MTNHKFSLHEVLVVVNTLMLLAVLVLSIYRTFKNDAFTNYNENNDYDNDEPFLNIDPEPSNLIDEEQSLNIDQETLEKDLINESQTPFNMEKLDENKNPPPQAGNYFKTIFRGNNNEPDFDTNQNTQETGSNNKTELNLDDLGLNTNPNAQKTGNNNENQRGDYNMNNMNNMNNMFKI